MVALPVPARTIRADDSPSDHARRATLTVEEAAVVLGIGRTLAFELARKGQIPTIRLGRRILVPRAALDRMLEGDTHESAGLTSVDAV